MLPAWKFVQSAAYQPLMAKTCISSMQKYALIVRTANQFAL